MSDRIWVSKCGKTLVQDGMKLLETDVPFIPEALAQAMVAAAYEDASELLPESWGASRMEMRSRTPADARAALDAMLAKAREEGEQAGLRKAATLVSPAGDRPCDCDGCYCGNSDDNARVSAWDDANYNSSLILALIDRAAEGDI